MMSYCDGDDGGVGGDEHLQCPTRVSCLVADVAVVAVIAVPH